ncbi:MAG: PDZ domain-containing protein [Planctomycetes bacterium]|nr:PDZ domain-containing protein [Planctomycetota bacterium]
MALGPGYLGVFLQSSDEAIVSEVIPGTAAQKAGLKAGDVMLAVGDKETPTRDAFIAAIQSHEAGERVKLKLRRGTRERVVVVKLGERAEAPGAGAAVAEVAEEPPAPKPRPIVEISRPAGGKGYLGVSVREADGGLAVDRVLDDGPCAKAGVKKGDVIMSIGDHRTRSLDELDAALTKVGAGRKVPMSVRRGDRAEVVKIRTGARPGSSARRNEIAVEAHEAKPRDLAVKVRKPAAVEVVVEEHAPKAVQIEVIEAKPAKPAKPAKAGKPAKPAKPATASKPRRASAQPGPTGPTKTRRSGQTDRDLQRELRDLRNELKELRKLLEELKRGGRE